MLLSPRFNLTDVTAADPAFVGQQLQIRDRESGGKVGTDDMKMRRLVVVAKNHHVERTNAANGRHALGLHDH
jgi:hypothetical protein